MSSRSRMSRKPSSRRRAPRASRAARFRSLRFETMELRHLLAGQGFLQGIAFYDANGDDKFDAGEAPKVGAEIQLLDEFGNYIDSEFTDSNGYYLFDELEFGTYQLHEPDTANYFSHGTQVLSQVNPAFGLNDNT